MNHDNIGSFRQEYLDGSLFAPDPSTANPTNDIGTIYLIHWVQLVVSLTMENMFETHKIYVHML